MMKHVLSTVAATLCAGVFVAAQTPQSPAPQSSSPGTTATQPRTTPSPVGTAPGGADATVPRASGSDVRTVTLVGCLYQEKDVPGRSPNIAERAGVMEDYILADALHPGNSATAGAVGTSGLSASGSTASDAAASKTMYKIEKIDDEKLKALVGKRVEVIGKIDPDDAAEIASGNATKADKNPVSPDAVDLPEFEAASIRAVEGSCPATPAR